MKNKKRRYKIKVNESQRIILLEALKFMIRSEERNPTDDEIEIMAWLIAPG